MAREQAQQEWPMIYTAIVALGAFAFLFSVKMILSPFIAFILLMVLISPWSGTRAHLLTVMCATFLLSIWLLQTLGGLLAPFILAFVLAYILNPLVGKLERRGIKRGLAVAMLFIPTLAILVLAVMFGVPALIEQIQKVAEQTPAALQRLVDTLELWRTRLENSRNPLFKGEGFDRMLQSFSAERVTQWISEQQAEIGRRIWGAVMGVGKGVTVVLSILGYVVLTPVLTIYLLLDFDKLTARAGSLIPRDKRATWIPFVREYDKLLSRYLRGQVLAGLIVGVLTWIGLLVLGFPYPGLVAVVAGVFNLIPYLGLVVSAVPGVLIALMSGNIAASLLKLLIVFGIVQAIDGTVTGPRIVGDSVGLHPVWVIMALAVGSFFFGFVGLLLAMPAAVFIKLIVRDAVARYKESRVFEGEAMPAE